MPRSVPSDSGRALAGHLVVRRDEAAIGHLFRVAAGLESLVPGEDQILGQVRDAYKAATGRGVTGPILHAAFQRALRAAKRARDETEMGRGKLSVASIAVDVARDVFDHFDDKTILVIGAGKMGELALQHFRACAPVRSLSPIATSCGPAPSPTAGSAASSPSTGSTTP